MKNKNSWCKTEERYLGDKGWVTREEYLEEKIVKEELEFRKIKIKGGRNE